MISFGVYEPNKIRLAFLAAIDVLSKRFLGVKLYSVIINLCIR